MTQFGQMRIQDAADSYLHDAPSDWLRLAGAIASRVAKRIATSLAAQASDIDPRPIAAALSDSFLAVLLDPQNVQVLVGADTDDQAVENKRDNDRNPR